MSRPFSSVITTEEAGVAISAGFTVCYVPITDLPKYQRGCGY